MRPTPRPVRSPERPACRRDSLPALGVAAAVVTVLLAGAGGYGYHRDELYYLASGNRLAWGYADHPPFTPLLARIADEFASGSLFAIRAPAALAAGITVLSVALVAREMGAGRRAQLIAAAVAASSTMVLVSGHFLSTMTFDLCFSAMLCVVAARLLRTRDPRWFVVAGVVVGVGLLNKNLLAAFVAMLLIAVAVLGPRELLRTRWLWVGGAIALLIWAPHLHWQFVNDWPQLTMAEAVSADDDHGGRLGFLPYQALMVSPLLVPVWIAGLVRLLRSPDAAAFRALGAAYLLFAVFLLVVEGSVYYLAGGYVPLLAAASISIDRWLGLGNRLARPRPSGTGWLLSRLRRRQLPGELSGAARRTTVVAMLALSACGALVVGLPVVPASALAHTPIVELNGEAGEQVGWPQTADTVAKVYRSLPAEDQRRTAIVAEGYPEAAALERFGPQRGLPEQVYSGNNAYAKWGPPPDDKTMAIIVGPIAPNTHLSWASDACRSLGMRARTDNGLAVDNDEQGNPVWVCQGLSSPWSQLWPRVTYPVTPP